MPITTSNATSPSAEGPGWGFAAPRRLDGAAAIAAFLAAQDALDAGYGCVIANPSLR